jgi:hypothetical protein
VEDDMEDGLGIDSHTARAPEVVCLAAAVERLSEELACARDRITELEALLETSVSEAVAARRDLGLAVGRYDRALRDFSEALDVAEAAVAERDVAVRWLAEGDVASA